MPGVCRPSYLPVLGLNPLLSSAQHSLIVLLLDGVPDLDGVGDGAVAQEGRVSAPEGGKADIFQEPGSWPSQVARHVYLWRHCQVPRITVVHLYYNCRTFTVLNYKTYICGNSMSVLLLHSYFHSFYIQTFSYGFPEILKVGRRHLWHHKNTSQDKTQAMGMLMWPVFNCELFVLVLSINYCISYERYGFCPKRLVIVFML